MRNKGQQIVAAQMGESIKIKDFDEWSPKRVELDARKFEMKITQDRIKLGLEVSHA